MWLEVSVLERKGTKMNEEKSWFKAFCESNRLRYRLAEDAHPVAVSAGKWKNDQFYDGFGQGIIGIYVRRARPRVVSPSRPGLRSQSPST